LYDADARLSQEYVDNGHWSPESRAFRVTAWVEEQSRRRADEIITLSENLRRDFIEEFKVSAPITVIPCCVDVERFRFDAEARKAIRHELQMQGEKLLVYVGKTGPRYLVEEMFGFFKVFQARSGAAKLLILSNEEAQNFHQLADRQEISRADYMVRQAPREKVTAYLSAADAGIAFVRSAVCERGSSPIKIGEYLATGLPVLITENIGDYSELIERKRLGVVLKGHTAADYLQSAEQLLALMDEGDCLKARCRQMAETNLSLKDIATARYDGVYQRLTQKDKAV
jgi:glycosyltransferase involved in cell wall biosynthesis